MSYQNQNKHQQQQQQQQWHQQYAHVASSNNNRAAPYSMNMFSGSGGSSNIGSGGCFDLEMGMRTHTAASTSTSAASAYNVFSHHNHMNLQQHHILPPQNIKMEPMDNILTPTIEMEELIIKTEPTDESYKISLANDDNSYVNFNKHMPTYHSNPLIMNTAKLQLQHVKEEIIPAPMSAQQQQQQQKPLNFPRRKLQNERSDTLPICQRCKQVFLKKHSYTKHVAQSVCDILEYDFKCCICPMSLMSNEELQLHEQLHLRNMYFCHKYCGKYFDTIELCEVHEYMQHEYQTFVCNICSGTFPTRELLFSHMPQHRNQPRFVCPVCRLWFHMPHELHQHRIAAPYFCGKFYKNNTVQTTSACTSFAAPPPMPPQHQQENYNLQDCRMGVMEVPTMNNFPSFGISNRSYHQQQQLQLQRQQQQQQLQQQRHQQQRLLQQQQSAQLNQQSSQLHHQSAQLQQSAQLHQQTLQNHHQSPVPQQQRNFMNSSFQTPLAQHTATSTTATTKATTPTMPIIKTEIKTEDDFFSINENYQPPLLPPDFSSNYTTTNDSYSSSHNSHHSFNSNNNDFNDNNSINNLSSATALQNALSTPAATSTLDDTDDASCCVPKCGVRKSTSPTLQFFTFPKDDKYLQQWLHNLKMPHNPQINYAHAFRICSLHFPKRCINRYSLCYWAVPTFNLGHDDVANLYQNREITNTFTTGENARCSMPGCASQRGECNFKFYNFPNDTKSVIKWCQNARLPVYSKEPRHFCSRHFEDRCFGKFRLKPWAVPTLNLGTPYGKIHDNPGIFYLEEKKCCLPHCRRTRSSDFNLSLYRFPRDETLLRRWCYNLRLDPDIYRGKNHKICSSHFIKEALGLRKLSPGAVPTLNLGHNDTFNIYENELPPAPAPPPPPPPAPSKKLYNYHSFHHNEERRHHHHHAYSSGHLSSTSALKFTISSMNSSATSQQLQKDFESVDVCFVPSCKRNRHTDNVSFHTIPRRPEQMKKWCHNLKLDMYALHKGVRICSAHFETYCIGGCMRPFAVPTLELGHDDPNIYKNPEVIKKLNIRETCCVPHCRRNRDRDHANLHRFPANPTLLDKWCENLRKALPDGTKLFNDAICEIHFEERCLRNKRLEKWSIPTVNLGHEEIIHGLPSEAEVAELWSKPTANIGDEEGECCVEICKRNPQVDDIKLYRMPEDPEVLAKWAYNLQLDAADLLSLRICNLHFESQCIGKRLHSWAIPTLNLGKTVENLFENPEEYMHHHVIKKEKKQKALKVYDPKKAWMPRCCLPHCRKMRGIDRVHLFRFPNLNRSMLAKWCHNLQMPLVGNGKRRLCSTHFESHVLTKRCPMPQSVPTVDLNTPPGYKIYQNPARLKLAKLRLERVCIVASCRKNRSDGVQLFRFPHNRTMLKKWCHNTRQKPAEAIRAQYRVCSQHFEPHSFGAKRLSPGAIPTLNLNYDDDLEIYANEAQSFAETQCIVSGCASAKDMDKVRLFKFPCEDEDLLWKWCNNLKMNPVDCQGVRICNRHFEQDCLGIKLLYKWAIPTLELGHDDADIELFSNPKPEERYNEIVSKCCVRSCGKTRKYDDAQMNSFPKHLKIFQRWKHNLKLEYLDFKERDKYKICNDHFEPICVGKMRLNYGAIPTLNLGHDDSDSLYKVDPEQIQVSLFGKQRPLHSVPIESQNRADDDAAVDNDDFSDVDDNGEVAELLNLDIETRCSYPHCNASKTLLREVFDMPQQQLLLEIWCALMNVEKQALPVEPKLCGLHFIEVYKDTKEMCDDSEIDTQTLQQIYERCCNSPAVRSAQCCVPRCNSNQFGSHKLYQFPASTEIIAKWAYNTGIEADDYRRYLHKVCALHFEPYCLTDVHRLRPWAIPTLQLNHVEPDNIYRNPNLSTLERRLLGPPTNKCCVAGCVREKTDDGVVKLFNFPTADEALLEKWLCNLKLEREQCPLYRICDQHFTLDCLGNTRLRSWAIPTLNLGQIDTLDIHQKAEAHTVLDVEAEDFTPPTHVKMKKSLDSIKCAVPSCRRSRLQHGVRLFEFPTRQIMLSKWCHNLQISRLNVRKHTKICNLHFHKRCIDGKQLRPWAKPTKNLGHTEVIYENPKNLPGIFLPVCCLPHCRQRRTLDNSLRTFALPKDAELLHKWCANLNITPKNSKSRICIDHFEAAARGKSKLKVGVVPTLNLGHNAPLAYNNFEITSNTTEAQQSLQQSSNMSSGIGDGRGTHDTDCEEARSFDANDDEADALDYDAIDYNGSENDDIEEEEETTTRKARKRSINSTVSDPLDYAADEVENKLDEPAAASVVEASSSGKKLRAINNIAGICCLRHCRKETTPEHHLTTFGFPKNVQLLQKWCDNLKLKPAQFMGRVCIEHFEPLMLAWGRRLKPGAIPTINLGYSNKDIKHKTISEGVGESETQPEAQLSKPKRGETDNTVEAVEDENVDENEDDEDENVEDEEENDANLNIESNNSTNDSTMNASVTSSTASSTTEKSHYAEKLNHSVFRLCCLKHCRRKKVQQQQIHNEEQHPPTLPRTFEFPKDELLLRKWCKKLKLPRDYCLGKRICEKHFEPQVIGDVKLSVEAVPTLDLGHGESYKPKKKQRLVRKHSSNNNNTNSVSNCVVAECGRNSSENTNLRFFRFPSNDSKQLQKWCDNLQLDANETISKSKICERHFESRTMGTKRLCNWAIPTLNLGHTQPIQYHNPKKFASTIPLRCCIESCRKTRKKHNVRLFSFPKSNPLLARKWCHNTKQPLRYTMRRICSEHFVKQAMLNGRPRPWAVPTANLGHNDAIFDNPARNLKELLNDKCCVAGCGESEKNAILFAFPKRGVLLRKWAHNTKQDGYLAQHRNYKVCAKHFVASTCFESDGTLKEQSIPTLYLPRVDIYTNENELETPGISNLICSITDCGRSVEQDRVKCFAFPKDSAQLAKWCHNLQLQQENCINSHICNLHFEAVCIKKNKLHEDAVPTLLLGYTNAAIELFQNPESLQHNTQSMSATKASTTIVIRCCVRGCEKSRPPDDVKMNSFPKSRALYLTWTHNLKLQPSNKVLHAYKVCNEHFEESCKGKIHLKYGAIPTLHLGHDDTNIYNNNMKLIQNGKKRRQKFTPAILKCIVPECSVAKLLNMPLYAMPENEHLQRRWCEYFDLDFKKILLPNCTKKLCALHFMKAYKLSEIQGCFNEQPASAFEKLHNNYERISKVTRLQAYRCSIVGCDTTWIDNIKLIKFPISNQELMAKWQHNTQIVIDQNRLYLYKVCALHFEERCFGIRIRPWALPTLRLNHADIYQNPPQAELLPKQLCCIQNCMSNEIENTNADGLKLWSFPNDKQMVEKWCNNLNLKLDSVNTTLKICSRHFEPYCIGKLLRVWAMPTLHLNNTSETRFIYQNPDNEVFFYTCCISTCRQTRDVDAGIKLYPFPKNEVIFEKWVHNVRMNAETCRYARICTLHFEKQCIDKMLLKTAVPTLDLGHTESDIFKNPKIKLRTHLGKCCLPHCGKLRHIHNVKLYSFPSEQRVLEKWWHNLRITQQKVKYSKICSKHFEPICINMRGLKPWAIPTRDLGHTHEITENITPTEMAEYDTKRKQLTLKDTTLNTSDLKLKTKKCSHERSITLKKCCISTCLQLTNTKLFSFPKLDWLLQKWCDNTHISIDAASTSKICAAHFEPQAMGKHKPRPWALPTLKLGHPENPKHENPKQNPPRFYPEEKESGEMKFVRSCYCAIVSCMKSKVDGVQHFKYPSKGSLLRKWAENCKHYAYQAARYSFRICSDHFEPSCINGNRLHLGSIPTLELGYTDTEQIHRNDWLQKKQSNSNAAAALLEAQARRPCCVPQCGRTKLDDNVKLFKFPDNEEMLEKWCINLRMEANANKCKHLNICNMHFEERCIKMGRVLVRAVPTLMLGHTDVKNIIKNPETFERAEIECCVRGCHRSKQEDNVTMCALPKVRMLFEKWVHNLKLPSALAWNNYKYKVCNAHFESYCFERGRLKCGSIPTLDLGHDDEDIYYINEESLSSQWIRGHKGRKHKDAALNTSGSLMEVKAVTNATIGTNVAAELKCCYTECTEILKGKVRHVYALPKVKALCMQWLRSLGLDQTETEEDLTSLKLCPVHFKLTYDANLETLQQMLALTTVDDMASSLQDLCAIYVTVSDLSRVRSLSCAVPNCYTSALSPLQIKLYHFPLNHELSDKWCHNTLITLDKDRRYVFKVCALHFETYCFLEVSKRLRTWAMPTLQLPKRPDKSVIFENPEPETLLERRSLSSGSSTQHAKCCISSCVNSKLMDASDTTTVFYNFPKDAELLNKWLYNADISMRDAFASRICALHFEKHCINKRLRFWAIPTLGLGHNKPEIYRNPENKREASEKKGNDTEIENVEKKKLPNAQKEQENAAEIQDEPEIATGINKDQSNSVEINDLDEVASEINDATEISATEISDTEENEREINDEPECASETMTQPRPQHNFSGVPGIMHNPHIYHQFTRFNESSAVAPTAPPPPSVNTSRHCRIPGCTGHADQENTSLYKFPIPDKQFKRWIHNTQIRVDTACRWRFRICNRHFEPACLSPFTKKLIRGTVPTLNLGPNRPTTIYENACTLMKAKKTNISTTSITRDDDDNQLLQLTEINDDISSQHDYNSSIHSSSFNINDCDAAADDSVEVDSTSKNEKKYICGTICCAIPNCGRKMGDPGIRLHKLPQNSILQRKWIYNCRLDMAAIKDDYHTRVCSNHFTEDCFYSARRKLRFASIPTLLLGHSDANIYHPNKDSSDLNDIDMDINCCVRGCNNRKISDGKKNQIIFYSFPKNGKALALWLSLLQMEYDASRPWDYNICELHFEAQAFYGNSLRENAVPTLNLGLLPGIDDFRSSSITLDSYSTPSTLKENAQCDIKSGYRKCCLIHCQKQIEKDNVKIYKFPSSAEQQEKWAHNLRIKYDEKYPWRYLICGNHFEDQCISYRKNRTVLFRWAVPTLNLGNNPPAILFTNENARDTTDGQFEDGNENDDLLQAENEEEENVDEDENDEYDNENIALRYQYQMNMEEEEKKSLDDDQPFEVEEESSLNEVRRFETAMESLNRGQRIGLGVDDNSHAYEDALSLLQYNDENSLLDIIREESRTTLASTPGGVGLVSAYATTASDQGSGAQLKYVRVCSLPHCQRQRSATVKLFRVPQDTEVVPKWEHNFRVRFDEKHRNTNLICSVHFEPHLIGAHRLMRGSVPTLDLGHSDTNIYTNDPNSTVTVTADGTGAFIQYCHVLGCGRSTKLMNANLFKFPRNKHYIKLWMQQTQIEYDVMRHEQICVCDAHFLDNCINTDGRLHKSAIPTLKLPNSITTLITATEPIVAQTKETITYNTSKPIVSSSKPAGTYTACSVPLCHNTSEMHSIKMFSKFPDDFELFTKWCFNLKIDPRKYIDGAYHICSAHFEPYCMGGHSLRLWAVPTLHLGHTSEHIHYVERPAEAETKCCLPHCGRKKSIDGVNFFNFPKGDLYKVWCQILQIDEGHYRNTDKKICSAHFPPYTYIGRILKPGVKPTRNLGPQKKAVIPPTTTSTHIKLNIQQHPEQDIKQLITTRNVTEFFSKCIVRTCAEMQHLYKFPENRNLCVKWCHNLKIDYHTKLHKNANFKICQKHFEPNCLYNRKLHAEAVPTLQLGHVDANIFQNTATFSTATRSTPSYDDNSSLRTSVSTINTLNMDADITADMDIEDDTYYTDFDERNLLPQSTFIATDACAVIELDDDDEDDVAHVAQEMQAAWDAVGNEDDDVLAMD